MNRILPTLKKHDPFATRYMDITETPRDSSSSSTFSFGPEYLMNVVILTLSSFIDPSFTTTTTTE